MDVLLKKISDSQNCVKNHKKIAHNVTIEGGGEDDDTKFVHEEHPWGIFFTVLGTVLLDFDADACQSPSRAYLLDVTTAGTFENIV